MDTESNTLNADVVLENPNVQSELFYWMVDMFELNLDQPDEVLSILIKMKIKQEMNK